jgi:ACS family hexuronate transporter-like MFS transporter
MAWSDYPALDSLSANPLSTAQQHRSEVSRAHEWLIAVAAMLAMAVSYLDRQTFAVLSPTISKELGLSDVDYGWLNSGFAFAYMVGALVAGRLIDRVGGRRGLLGALAIWSVVAGLHVFAAGFISLFVLRVTLGLAESPSFLGAAQVVRAGVSPARRPAAIGLLYSGSSIGAALAPVVALLLAARLGWRAAFFGTALAGLAWIPLWLYATSRVPSLVVHARPAPGQRVFPYGASAVVRAGLLMLGVAPVLAFFLLWGPKFLVAHYGSTGQEMAARLWIPPLCFDSGSLLFGGLASLALRRQPQQQTPYRVLALPALLLCLCIAIVPRAPTSWLAVMWSGLSLIGAGGLYAVLTADLLARVPATATGAAAGFMAASQSISHVIANPTIGLITQNTGGYASVCTALALWLLPMGVIWLVWQPQHPAVVAPAT